MLCGHSATQAISLVTSICIADKAPSDGGGAGPRTTLEELWSSSEEGVAVMKGKSE